MLRFLLGGEGLDLAGSTTPESLAWSACGELLDWCCDLCWSGKALIRQAAPRPEAWPWSACGEGRQLSGWVPVAAAVEGTRQVSGLAWMLHHTEAWPL